MVIFHNIADFNNFEDVCRKENIQFHTFTIASEKILTVVLKSFIKLNEKTILNDIKTQGLKPINCIEIPTHTRYPVYRVTFVPGITLAKVNQVRFVENIKVYWEKYESRKPYIQYYRCQAHDHSSTNCNKNAVCVKCAGSHNTKECTKSFGAPPTCSNCQGNHTANYSKCPALLFYLAKKTTFKTQHLNSFHPCSHFLRTT